MANLVDTLQISSISTKPFATKVDPVSTKSTTLLHKPIEGANSKAPFNLIHSA